MSKKQIALRIGSFILIFSILFLSLERYFWNGAATSDTWADIQDPEADPPDILFMGNSHLFTAIIPDLIQQSTGLKAEILGSSAQNAEITKRNLEIVLAHKTPKYIVIEVNAVLSANMEDLLAQNRGFLLNNFDGIQKYPQRFSAIKGLFATDYIPEALFQLFRPSETWERWKKSKNSSSLTKLGYLPKTGFSNVGYKDSHGADTAQLYANAKPKGLTDYNIQAFQEILDLTASKNIPVYLYKNMIGQDVQSYQVDGIQQLLQYTEEYDNVHWLGDWNLVTDEIGINAYDFYDKGHLNQKGAVKNTVYMIQQLEEFLDIQADYSSVFAYRSEQIDQLKDGSYRFTIENFSPDTLYSFYMKENGKTLFQTEYSDQNYIDLPRLPSRYQSLAVYMLPADCDMTDTREIRERRIAVTFMREAKSKEYEVLPNS